MEWIETPAPPQAKAAGNRHSPNLMPPRRSLTLRVPCQGTQVPWVTNPTRRLSLQPEAPRASQEATNDLKHFGKTALQGVKRAMRAAT